jgi:hypothetical protein
VGIVRGMTRTVLLALALMTAPAWAEDLLKRYDPKTNPNLLESSPQDEINRSLDSIDPRTNPNATERAPTPGELYHKHFVIEGYLFQSAAVCGEGQAERVKLSGHRIIQAHPELQTLIDAYPKMTMQWDVEGGKAFTRDMLAYGVPKVCAFVADMLDKAGALFTPAEPPADYTVFNVSPCVTRASSSSRMAESLG